MKTHTKKQIVYTTGKKHKNKYKEVIFLASYVLLIKKTETKEIVVYQYGPDESSMGEILFNKCNLGFQNVKSVEGDEKEFYFKRAAMKITMISAEGKGIFPDKTFFAS